MKSLPKKNLGADLPLSAGLPLFLDLCIIPVAAFLGVVRVVVDHDDHSWLQLMPLVDCTSPWTNVLAKQLNDSILWVAVKHHKSLNVRSEQHNIQCAFCRLYDKQLLHLFMPLGYYQKEALTFINAILFTKKTCQQGSTKLQQLCGIIFLIDELIIFCNWCNFSH